MRYGWLAVAIVAGAGLSGCASTGGGCRAPAYVVPPPLPPLQVPSGMSTPPDHSRYAVNGQALPSTTTRQAPGTGREAEPPAGPVAPAATLSPPASSQSSATAKSSQKAPPGMSGPPLSNTRANSKGESAGSVPLAAPATSTQ